jgi:hypothetical protein
MNGKKTRTNVRDGRKRAGAWKGRTKGSLFPQAIGLLSLIPYLLLLLTGCNQLIQPVERKKPPLAQTMAKIWELCKDVPISVDSFLEERHAERDREYEDIE